MASKTAEPYVFEGQHLRAKLFQPGQKRLFVSFDSFKPTRNGFPERGAVKFYLEQGWSQLQIQTARNDWYLNDDLEPLRAVLAEVVAPYRRVSAMGFSMGGYGALLMSKALHLGHVFLVSPQITPFSDKGPLDPRYARFAPQMRADLDLRPDMLQPGMRGFVMFDPLGKAHDRDHARMIEAMAPGLRAVALPMAGHPADKTMLEGKAWPAFQALLMDKKCKAASIRALHRAGRLVSGTYQKALAKRLAARARRQAAGAAVGNSLPCASLLGIGPGKPEGLSDSASDLTGKLVRGPKSQPDKLTGKKPVTQRK